MIRVLYVEDDSQIVDMVLLRFQLLDPDYVLTVVDSGRKCLELMERGGFDVVLLDLVIADLDGLTVLGALTARQDPTPVIMVSSQGQYELAVRALRAGAVDCIDKTSPDFNRIAEITQRVVHRHKRLHLPRPRVSDRRVLYIDGGNVEHDGVANFFRTTAPQLHLDIEGPGAIERMASGDLKCDAVVLGPSLEATVMLDSLRHLRGRDENLPAIVVSDHDHAETTVAAFKLGAHDYLLRGQNWLTELVFSLNNALKQADVERLNAQLANELAELNRSLAEQVVARTRELEQEVVVRRDAEKRAEENAARSQSLSSRLLRVQEDERRALAQELHDQVGQLLTGLRFQLESARASAPSPSLDDALTVTADLLKTVRELTLQLRPRILDDLGLKPALEWHARLFEKQTGIKVDLELSLPAGRFTAEMEITAFRVVQEALTNVARHSGTNVAMVTVTADDSVLQVEVADRGRGFDVAGALNRRDSLGLAGLAERVRLAGGQLEIVSKKDQGTRVHAELFLPQPASPSVP